MMKGVKAVCVLVVGLAVLACAKNGTDAANVADEVVVERGADMEISVVVNGQALKAVLFENSSSRALYALLEQGDLTLEMHDYGGFEKVGTLPEKLPTNDETIDTQAGDLILYQGDSFVIYYDHNRWSLTRLGVIVGHDQASLKNILGTGDAMVTLTTKDYTIHSDWRP